jgi:hypothetical protein
MEVSGQLQSQGKSSWYTLDRRLGGLTAGLDAAAKKETSSLPCRELNPGHSARRPVTILKLLRLLGIYIKKMFISKHVLFKTFLFCIWPVFQKINVM